MSTTKSPAPVATGTDPGLNTPVLGPVGPLDVAPEPVPPGPGLGITATVPNTIPVLTTIQTETVNVAAATDSTFTANTVTPGTVRYISISSDGTVINSQATNLNFVGDGVGVANGAVAGTVTITINGGGSGNYGNSNVAAFLAAFGSNAISTTGNVTGTYIKGNGSQLTGMYGNANVVANLAALGSNPISTTGNISTTANVSGNYLLGNGYYITDYSYVHGHILIYNGTSNTYVYNSGNVAVSVAGTSNVAVFTTTGLSVTGNVSATNFIGNGATLTNLPVANITGLGNIATVNLDGSSSNVLYGNGVFAPATGGGNVDLGNITFTGDDIGSTNNVVNITASNYAQLQSNNSFMWVENNEADIEVNGNIWKFAANGSVTFPTLTVNIHNGGNQAAQTLQFGDPTQQAIITGPTPAVDTAAQRLIIQGQRGSGLGEGGDVYVWGGDSDINGGDIKIYAGDSDGATGSGGYVNIDGGAGADSGGYITLNGGYSSNGSGGYININGGQGANGAGGHIQLQAGQSSGTGVDGANILLQGGYSSLADGGPVTVRGGQSAQGLNNYGNVLVEAGASQWRFDNSGNVTIPKNILGTNSGAPIVVDAGTSGDSYISIPSFQDGGEQLVIVNKYGSSQGIRLQTETGNFVISGNSITFPDSTVQTTAYTGGGGGTGNALVNGTNAFTLTTDAVPILVLSNIGGSIGSFQGRSDEPDLLIDSYTGNVVISANDTKEWKFDNTGNLTLPGGGSVYSAPAPISGNMIVINPHGSGATTNQLLMVYPTAADGDHIHIATGNLYQTELFLGSDDYYVKLANTGYVVVNANDSVGNIAQWQFSPDGWLSFPAGGAIGYDAPTSSLQTTYEGNISLNNAGGAWLFDDTGDLTVPGNIKAKQPGFAFGSSITGITTGNPTVIVTLSNSPFGGPVSGTVRITDVTGTIQANGVWGWQATEGNEFQLFTDATLSTPVDGTTWSGYISGGFALSTGFNDLDIQGGNVSITNGADNSWTFTDAGYEIKPNQVVDNTTSGITCNAGAPTVIYTATDQFRHTIKLLIQVEGVETIGQPWDTQSCEMVVAKSFRNNNVVGSVYGLAYTSTNPLATFNAVWNPTSSRVEITCTPTSLTTGVTTRVVVTEMTTSD